MVLRRCCRKSRRLPGQAQACCQTPQAPCRLAEPLHLELSAHASLCAHEHENDPSGVSCAGFHANIEG
jgi:hypothetical protein